jgi:GSH-dependent disulfide-bond oxidoreductase
MLEDLLADGVAEAEYDAWLIDISKGDQFGSGFVELKPNFERQEKASWPRNR